MKKNKKTLIAFLSLFLFTGCASFRIPDFKAHITLPASGDGFWLKTVSNEEGRIPKKEWDVLKKRGIVILSEDWAILRYSIMKACLTSKDCKDTVGMFDSLFYTIDSALEKTTSTPSK